MELKYKSFPAEVKVLDKASGVLEAVVAVLNNIDMGKERIRPGFFTESLARKKPKGVWMHDWTQTVAKTLDAKELAAGDPLLPDRISLLGGYYIKGQFNLDTQRGKEAFSDIAFGIVDEFSIGYSLDKWQYNEDEGVLDLIKGDWYEWSPVLVGMNPETALLSAKTLSGGLLAGLRFDDHSEVALAAVKGFITRATELRELRSKVGRELSAANRVKLGTLADQMESGVGTLRELLAATEPKAARDAVLRELASYQKMVATINGEIARR